MTKCSTFSRFWHHCGYWLVDWKINVPFKHTNRLYWGQGRGWRFSLRMANDTVTSRPYFLFVQQHPKMGKGGEAHLSYYASIYSKVKTNQTQ